MKSTLRTSPIFDIGDIVRVPFPHVESDRRQARPAVVVGRAVGPAGLLTWTVMITSARRDRWPDDIDIGDRHADYGLPRPSRIRMAKIAAIETRSIEARTGVLLPQLLLDVQHALASALGIGR